MPLKKDASGRRSIQVETEVPGTQEQVWQAIATGPGVSAWFVPTRVEEGPGGVPVRVIMNFGPGMDSVATVTAWDAPRRYAAESQNLPGAPPMLTEWSVEARAGGTCIVRVVHSMATTSDAWDKELESMESGWPGFFLILRLYLTHFPGQACAAIRGMAMPSSPEAEVWATLTKSLGMADAAPGQQVGGSASAPAFTGSIEHVSGWPHCSLLLRIEQPAPGIAAFGAFNCGGLVMVSIMLSFFGSDAPAIVAQHDSQWQAWLNSLFPAAAGAAGVTPGSSG